MIRKKLAINSMDTKQEDMPQMWGAACLHYVVCLFFLLVSLIAHSLPFVLDQIAPTFALTSAEIDFVPSPTQGTVQDVGVLKKAKNSDNRVMRRRRRLDLKVKGMKLAKKKIQLAVSKGQGTVKYKAAEEVRGLNRKE